MEHRRIIKQGPIVLATREDGTMDPEAPSAQGLFLADTRFLSRFQITLNGECPMLLGSSAEILFEAAYLHTNPPIGNIPARALGVLQRNVVHEGVVEIHVIVANWSLADVSFRLGILLASDFYDSFEARGVKRLKRGTLEQPKVNGDSIELSYLGLDHITRINRIRLSRTMDHFEDNVACFDMSLKAGERSSVVLSMELVERGKEGGLRQPLPEIGRTVKPEWFDDNTKLTVDNARVQAIIQRSIEDMEVLLTEFPEAWVPAAGLPRFSLPFGRDSIITALETLVWNPRVAHDALIFLGITQGTEENPWNYEQPGKIMHEMHTGELARLNAVPFGLFYGSVDSTPLFLALGAEYIRWTGDLDLFHRLEKNFQAAWEWCDKYGNIDGSGYIQYKAHTPPKMSSAALTVGLFNQGWKDSATAVVYSNGQIVTDQPVSLAEVQGDYYRALSMWAEVYESMPASEGKAEEAQRLKQQAAKLKEQFNREFWMPDKGYYAMGLDGHHRPIDSITSNPGECFWTRLIADEHAAALADRLLSESMFTDWGIRTMANTERAYNPFSYHDGSVWPFENALITSGLKKYGFLDKTQRIFDAMVEASLYFEYRRWPEVYCGVSQQIGGVLAQQPDASSPQAWSTGAIFMLVQTLLGIAARPFARRVDLTPALPTSINELTAENISIAGCRLGIRLRRAGSGVLIDIFDNPGDMDIVIHPVHTASTAAS